MFSSEWDNPLIVFQEQVFFGPNVEKKSDKISFLLIKKETMSNRVLEKELRRCKWKVFGLSEQYFFYQCECFEKFCTVVMATGQCIGSWAVTISFGSVLQQFGFECWFAERRTVCSRRFGFWNVSTNRKCFSLSGLSTGLSGNFLVLHRADCVCVCWLCLFTRGTFPDFNWDVIQRCPQTCWICMRRTGWTRRLDKNSTLCKSAVASVML